MKIMMRIRAAAGMRLMVADSGGIRSSIEKMSIVCPYGRLLPGGEVHLMYKMRLVDALFWRIPHPHRR